MRRKITHGHEAGKKVATRLLTAAGVPRSHYVFDKNIAFYLILKGVVGVEVREYVCPYWGMGGVKQIVAEFVRDRKAKERA